MGYQKIINSIKLAVFSFLFLGITTMNYAENFSIKYKYTDIVKANFIPMSTSYNTIAISNDDYIIIDNFVGSSPIKSEDFGIYKAPLTEEMKVRTKEVNQLLRMPHIEKLLATSNKEKDFSYVLNSNTPMEKYGTIEGLEVKQDWNLEHFLKYGSAKQAKNSQKISQFYIDLIENFYSKNRVKFADFYGTTNIIPKKEGLEVIVTFKNVGPFDVKVSSPKDFQDISKDQYYDDSYKKWYELRIGGLYKDVGVWFRIFLLSDYLFKDGLTSDEIKGSLLTVKSDSERIIKFLIPYKKIKVELSNGEIDTNRTKEGYIHLDHNAAIILSNWNMYVDFGGIFSKEQVWKEEKSSQVKGWVNLK